MRTRIQQATFLSALLLAAAVVFPQQSFAQNDGSMPRSDEPATTTAEDKPADGGATEPAVIAVPPETPVASPAADAPATTTTPTETPPASVPIPPTPSPTPILTPKPQPTVENATTSATLIVGAPTLPTVVPVDTEQDEDDSSLLFLTALLAVLPFGYFATKFIKGNVQNNNEDCSRCYELKKLLENKLKELTDLKEQAKEFAGDLAREKLLDRTEGTKTGKVLVLADKAEEEYERLRKLFEECMTDFERSAYRGVIIENSLVDAKLLDKMKIEHTDRRGEETIQRVFIGKKLSEKFAEHMHEGPWCAYFWKQGSDELRVVFKDKFFVVRSSDRKTWIDAIAHGKKLGIPDEQLDFSTEIS